MKYRYHWEVTYRDGTRHSQFAGGRERSIAELDFSQIGQIRLVPSDPQRYPAVTLEVNEGEKAIKFWQHEVDFHSGETVDVAEVLGVQKNVNGKAVKFFVFFHADGRVWISTKQDH